MVSIEPDVEILRKQEIKQKEKIILGRHRKRLYRRLIPILVATGLLLCLTILILQYRHYKPVMPQPTDVSQVEAALEEFSSQLPAQPSTPNHEESVSVAWYNYTEEVEQRVLDEKITFTLENHSSQVREVLLLTSRNPSMKPVERKKNIKQCLNGSGGSIRLRNVAGLKKGIWYLQVYLKTGDGEIVSKPRGIEIVGQ